MKFLGLHLRKDGCWREVPQPGDDMFPVQHYPTRQRPQPIVLRLLFEWRPAMRYVSLIVLSGVLLGVAAHKLGWGVFPLWLAFGITVLNKRP